jgi:hypothetical protein
MQDETQSDDTTLENAPKRDPHDTHNAADVPSGNQLKNELDSMSGHTDKLESAMALPHVDEDGNSECPWAERLYAKKEELEVQVTNDVEKMKCYSKGLNKEKQRCERNLAQLQADRGELNLPEPSEYYSNAIEAQQRQLQSVIDDIDAVSIVLKRAEAVLKVSRTRKFPGGEPQEGFPFPAMPSGAPGWTCIQPSLRQPGDEIDGLVSLGPLGN